MRPRLVPVVAISLALLWLGAELGELPSIAAAVAVLALLATGLSAIARRRRRLALGLGVSALVGVVGLLFATLFLAAQWRTEGLLVMLATMALLAPLAPLLYALTFDGGDP